MDRAKKGLMISSLVSLGIACVLLILAVFKIKVFEGVLLHILLVFATLTLASAFMINELNVIKRDKVLGSVSSALLLLSVLFAFIIFCSPLLENGGYFCTATAIISIFSIFFMIIISIKTKLNKRFFAIQIVAYILLCILDIFLSILIGGFNLFSVTAMTEIFGVLCVVTFGIILALIILSVKRNNQEVENQDFVKILKSEYENLLKENKELKEEIKNLKNKADK